MSDSVCDFCAAPEPTWMFPARDFDTGFDTPDDSYISMGGWAACDDCKAAAEEGLGTLLTRATDHYLARHPEAPRPFVERHLRFAYIQFYEHVVGRAVPIEEMIANCPHEETIFSEKGKGSLFLATGWYCARCGEPVDKEGGP